MPLLLLVPEVLLVPELLAAPVLRAEVVRLAAAPPLGLRAGDVPDLRADDALDVLRAEDAVEVLRADDDPLDFAAVPDDFAADPEPLRAALALRVAAVLRAAVARLAVERDEDDPDRLEVERAEVERRLDAGFAAVPPPALPAAAPAARLTGSGVLSSDATRFASDCTSLRSASMRSPRSTLSRRRPASELSSSIISCARFWVLAAPSAVAAKVFSTAERTLSALEAFLSFFFFFLSSFFAI